ncbi:MAG: hypothetical protein FJX22_00395 [Alphaproteobacteria bacterium]|nr:hypothetical protein [Alphaproteobacteria bacterium]
MVLWLGLTLGVAVMPTPALAGGAAAGACKALIIKYGCLAQAFGCHPAPPYPCTVFDNPKFQQAIKEWIVEKAINMLLELIQDGRVDWNRAFGGLIKNFSKGDQLTVPDLTPILPYMVPSGDSTKASMDPDPARKRAGDLCYSYVAPKYGTGTTQERQQRRANLDDAIAACAVRQIASAKWAQHALVEHHKNFPTLEKLSKKVCGSKNVGTLTCNKALEIEIEKHTVEGYKILESYEVVKKECENLLSYKSVNTRVEGSERFCGGFVTQ